MKAVVEVVVKATPSVVILRLTPDTELNFKPGQFIQIFIQKDGKTLRKAYSISSSPLEKSKLDTCIKVISKGYASTYLANLKAGEKLQIAGPFGHFILQDEIDNDLVFIATGTGISAIKPMIDVALDKTDKNVWLFFGVRTEKDLIYKDEFNTLASTHKNFHFVPVLSRDNNPDFEQGHAQDAFKKLIKPNSQDIYICGLYKMVDEVKSLCKKLGYADEKVHFEKYV